MTKLTQIEGIGETYAQKLEQAGIPTIAKLLEQGASPKGRQEIVTQTGISPTLLASRGSAKNTLIC
jgi:hypothetical protein